MTSANDPINLGSEVDKCGNPIKEHLGLTKREYFAAMALQGMMDKANWLTDSEYTSKQAVVFADALINALNETK